MCYLHVWLCYTLYTHPVIQLYNQMVGGMVRAKLQVHNTINTKLSD